MHVVKVLDNMEMGDSVKGFVKVNKDSKDSMWLLEIKRGVDIMQELDQIVYNGGAFHAILSWVHVQQDER